MSRVIRRAVTGFMKDFFDDAKRVGEHIKQQGVVNKALKDGDGAALSAEVEKATKDLVNRKRVTPAARKNIPAIIKAFEYGAIGTGAGVTGGILGTKALTTFRSDAVDDVTKLLEDKEIDPSDLSLSDINAAFKKIGLDISTDRELGKAGKKKTPIPREKVSEPNNTQPVPKPRKKPEQKKVDTNTDYPGDKFSKGGLTKRKSIKSHSDMRKGGLFK